MKMLSLSTNNDGVSRAHVNLYKNLATIKCCWKKLLMHIFHHCNTSRNIFE